MVRFLLVLVIGSLAIAQAAAALTDHSDDIPTRKRDKLAECLFDLVQHKFECLTEFIGKNPQAREKGPILLQKCWMKSYWMPQRSLLNAEGRSMVVIPLVKRRFIALLNSAMKR